MNIDFANLNKHYQLHKDEIDTAMHAVLDKSNYIMGEEIVELENALERFTGAAHAITCSSGTDALLLAMMALDIGPGDEVITTPFTFIATAETIAFLGAKPVFVDIDATTYTIDVSKIAEKITDKTKAIMPVSLYGQPSDMDAIQAVAHQHQLKVIVDGAQSFGSIYKGKSDSNLGDISTTSFFPAKPLGCFGDGGAVFTNDDALADKIKSLRVHGQTKRYHHQYIGMGGRLDTIQAAVLNVKLKYYDEDIIQRQRVAQRYSETLKQHNIPVVTPVVTKGRNSVWAQYSVQVDTRDKLQSSLKDAGIPTAVHYPRPLHLQECFEYLGYTAGDFPVSERVADKILSLPMNPELGDDEVDFIVQALRKYFLESY